MTNSGFMSFRPQRSGAEKSNLYNILSAKVNRDCLTKSGKRYSEKATRDFSAFHLMNVKALKRAKNIRNEKLDIMYKNNGQFVRCFIYSSLVSKFSVGVVSVSVVSRFASVSTGLPFSSSSGSGGAFSVSATLTIWLPSRNFMIFTP